LIIFSCEISNYIFLFYRRWDYQLVENFYSHIDDYAQTAVTGNNTVDNPYVPKPLQDVSQPLKSTPLQSLGQ
jgi:hypothetical protein